MIFVGIGIAIWAQARVSSTFRKYSQVKSQKGQSAADVARNILDKNGLHDVPVERIQGNLTDHYDPRHHVLRLSEPVYNSSSVAAIGVAAHEVGHAVQHQTGYVPLKIRSAMVPVVNFASYASWILIIVGILFGALGLAQIGVIVFGLAVVFQLVTLPVEFNASKRALVSLSDGGFLYQEEVNQAKKVLSAAALTYVAALLVSLLQFLRLLLIFGGRRE
ncbi:MAG: zinc metallopeptidase [Bacillota bacterium]